MTIKNHIMTSEEVGRSVARISHEILEKNKSFSDLVIIGIQRRGVSLANMIAENLKKFEDIDIPVGILDITLYRDDLSLLAEHPIIKGTEIDFSIEGKDIILVDDVLYTGRTVYAALTALKDFGRAKSIQLAVLIDRGHREMPIRPDYVGKNIPTSSSEVVHVKVTDFDGEDSVSIYLKDEE